MAFNTFTNNRLTNIFSNKKNSSISTAGFTILMIVLMLVLAILPAYKSITDQLKSNEVKLKYLTDLKQKKADMDSLNQEYNNNKEKIELFEKYNNSKVNSEILIANLAFIANNNNCKLINTIFLEDNTSVNEEISYIQNLITKPINITVLGTLTDLNNFLKDIENFPIVININRINYQPYRNNKESSEENVLDNPLFTLTLNSEYYYFMNNE